MDNHDFFRQLVLWMDDRSDTGLEIHDVALLAETLTGRRPAGGPAARRASVTQLAISEKVLARVREHIDGPIVLLKGLEVANLYPNPSDRSFGDLDLLVPDADAIQARLLDSGAELIKSTTGHVDPAIKHDLPPLQFPDLPVPIEIHRKLGALSWSTQPPTSSLVQRAVASSARVDGVLTLHPVDHALFLIDHSWRHQPFHRMRDLVDIRLMAKVAGERETATAARGWGLEGVMRELQRAEATLLRGEAPSIAFRLFGRHLARTAQSSHASRISADLTARFFVTPPRRAVASLVTDLRNRVRSGEPLTSKVHRVARTAGDVPAGQKLTP